MSSLDTSLGRGRGRERGRGGGRKRVGGGRGKREGRGVGKGRGRGRVSKPSFTDNNHQYLLISQLHTCMQGTCIHTCTLKTGDTPGTRWTAGSTWTQELSRVSMCCTIL